MMAITMHEEASETQEVEVITVNVGFVFYDFLGQVKKREELTISITACNIQEFLEKVWLSAQTKVRREIVISQNSGTSKTYCFSEDPLSFENRGRFISYYNSKRKAIEDEPRSMSAFRDFFTGDPTERQSLLKESVSTIMERI
jgi:hypothetical protein